MLQTLFINFKVELWMYCNDKLKECQLVWCSVFILIPGIFLNLVCTKNIPICEKKNVTTGNQSVYISKTLVSLKH